MEQKMKFNTRQALLNSFLLGNRNQVTILMDDSHNHQTFTTLENFILYNVQMNGDEFNKLEKEGYAYMLEVGGFYFLAKTLIRYTKHLTNGSARKGDIEPLQLNEDSWEINGKYGEIRPDWQEMVKLNTQKL